MDAIDYLKAIRDTGMTQMQVAERTGITQSSISKIERGDVSDVRSKSYRALVALHAEVMAKNTQPEAA